MGCFARGGVEGVLREAAQAIRPEQRQAFAGQSIPQPVRHGAARLKPARERRRRKLISNLGALEPALRDRLQSAIGLVEQRGEHRGQPRRLGLEHDRRVGLAQGGRRDLQRAREPLDHAIRRPPQTADRVPQGGLPPGSSGVLAGQGDCLAGDQIGQPVPSCACHGSGGRVARTPRWREIGRICRVLDAAVSGTAAATFRARLPMRRLASIVLTLAAAAALPATSGCARPDRPVLSSPTSVAVGSHQIVDLEVVSDRGSLPAHLYGGSVFVEGLHGSRYSLRLTNNTAERVEAVVTVDGRDVVSGELGNYKKQRGYVLGAFESVYIDGYRQSLDHVAAFRFAELPESYSARRGSPEHVGVIGVAVFREKTRRNKPKPVAVGHPYYEDGDYASRASAGEPFPEAEDAERAPIGDGAFAPAPEPRNHIGTAYGETRTSVVHETRFRRRRKRKPDALLTVYYDSHDGLVARGVLPQPFEPVFVVDPEPFPGPFAPPPPVWR